MAGKFCGDCGAPRKEGSQFCGNCGSSFAGSGPVGGGIPPPGRTAASQPPPVRYRGLKIPGTRVAAIAVVILVIAGAALFFILPKTGFHIPTMFPGPASPTVAESLFAGMDASKIHSFGSVRDTGSGYTMTMDPVRVDKDVSLQKTMTYARQSDGKYAGTMTLRFTGTSTGSLQYQETIPKSFASDVKYLTFSVPPDRILRADPVVAWSKEVKGSSDITVTSSETKTKEEARIAAEDVLINSSLDECLKLKEDDQVICALEIVRKYRTNPTVSNLTRLDASDVNQMMRAAIVKNDSHRWCHYLNDQEKMNACEQGAFIMFMRDCNEGPEDARADCIRNNLWDIENYPSVIGVCEYIADPGLRAECLGIVDTGYCTGLSTPRLREECLAHAGQHKADISFCNGIEDTYRRNDCIGKVSLARLNESICSVIPDPGPRDSCIADIALGRKDVSLCLRISDPDDKARCINYIGAKGAFSEDPGFLDYWNLTLCNSETMKASQEGRDFCIAMVAVRNINPDLCEQIQDVDSRNSCFLTFSLTGDTSVCTRIDDDYMKDHCFKIIAEGTKDADICNDVADKELAAECRNNIRRGVNAGTVLNETQLAEARKRVKSANMGINPAGSICESPAFKLAQKVVPRDPDSDEHGGIDEDHCYQAIAVNLGDTSLCPRINRPAPRSKCYLLIAEKQETTDACFLMPDPMESMDSYSQIECIQSVAIRTGNSRFCDEMGDRKISRMLIGLTNKSMCYQRVAGAKTAGGST